MYLEKIRMHFVVSGPIDNRLAILQLIAWGRTGELMMIEFMTQYDVMGCNQFSE